MKFKEMLTMPIDQAMHISFNILSVNILFDQGCKTIKSFTLKNTSGKVGERKKQSCSVWRIINKVHKDGDDKILEILLREAVAVLESRKRFKLQ